MVISIIFEILSHCLLKMPSFFMFFISRAVRVRRCYMPLCKVEDATHQLLMFIEVCYYAIYIHTSCRCY